MKIFKSPQRVLILFLSVFLILSSIFIVRLEIKAASLQSQWEKHQKSLKANDDTLEGLKLFYRSAGQSVIKIQDNDILLAAPDFTWVIVSKGKFTVDADDIWLGSTNERHLGYDSKKNLTYLDNDDAKVVLGDIATSGGKEHGILIESKYGDSEVFITDKRIEITGTGSDGDYSLDIWPDKKYVRISQGKSFVQLIKDNIEVEAQGDINITSKNGNVNIKGKKVNLNE